MSEVIILQKLKWDKKMKEDCKEKHHNCGEFAGNEDKETKLKHLKDCKGSLQNQIKKIDEAISKLEK